MKAFSRIVIVLILAAAGFWAYRANYAPREALVSPVIRDVAVSAVPARVTVVSERDFLVKVGVPGRIVDTKLLLGNEVEAGVEVARLDGTQLELEIERIQSDLEALEQKMAIGSQFQFELTNAEEELRSKERLAKSGVVAQTDIDRAARRVEQLKQQLQLEKVAQDQTLDTLRNNIKSKQANLEQMSVKLPIAGVVAKTYAGIGDVIGSDTVIAEVIAHGRIVEARISEESFAGVELGQQASVRFLSYGNQQYPAKVVKILPVADPETRRYLVHLEVEIDRQRLVPGLTGEASIVVGKRADALIIPRRALLGDLVYVVKDGVVEARRVKTGYTSLNDVEILEGLGEGDLVIVEFLEEFLEGDRVTTQLLP